MRRTVVELPHIPPEPTNKQDKYLRCLAENHSFVKLLCDLLLGSEQGRNIGLKQREKGKAAEKESEGKSRKAGRREREREREESRDRESTARVSSRGINRRSEAETEDVEVITT